MEGVIATNTTLSRERLAPGSRYAEEIGGLSGRPLHEQSLAIVRRVRELIGPGVVLIGAGGVASGADAQAMRDAGADLVQIYTALVYRGPALIREAVAALSDR
jgi:dihydroorotate dehydrogenase